MTTRTQELNANMPKKTLISFDLDNTLWPTRTVISRAERSLRHWLQQHHPQAASTGLNQENFFTLRQQIVDTQPALATQPTLLRKTILNQGFKQSGYATETAKQASEDAFETFIQARNHISFFPQALEMLRHLAKEYPLIAITNGNADLKRIGISHLFQAQYTAELVGHAKPAPEIYQHVTNDLQVNPEDIIHIGDNPVEDIQAADAIGIRTLWANLTNAQWPTELPPPKQHVTHLSAIPQTLKTHYLRKL